MNTEVQTSQSASPSRGMFWAGWVITAVPILMMGVGGVAMIFFPQPMREGLTKAGYPPSVGPYILGLEIVCALIYAVPRTAVLGAVLLTGYLGGATATHVRVGEPWFFPVIFGVLVWLGLFLRDARVRALLPLRSTN